jgi:hypothetical protein
VRDDDVAGEEVGAERDGDGGVEALAGLLGDEQLGRGR